MLNFKEYDLKELWKQFSHVSISASLDGMEKQGEYLRSEMNWNDVVQNRQYLLKELPHVDFMVSPTVYAFNVLHLSDFHQEWVEQGFIKTEDFFPTLLIEPSYHNIRVLPQELKEKAKGKIQLHIEWMNAIFSEGDRERFHYIIQQYQNIISHMMSEDKSSELEQLLERTNKLDQIRKESARSIFPELQPIFDHSE